VSFSEVSTSATQASALPRLRLSQLRKTLGNSPIVNGIDLDIARGEAVVLLGPSGCGKTTTLRMIAGFIDPDGGEIRLNGELAADAKHALPPEKRHLGMMFQNYAVWPHKSVFDNVAYGLQLAKLPKAEIHQRVMRMLESVNLAALAQRKPAELSGGQQQRVALARALVTEPSLLLMDEPLSNLDASLRQSMRHELKTLQRRVEVAMLYVTHDQEEALVLADRVVVMNAGNIEQIGTPEEVYQRPRNAFVATFIGQANLLDGEVRAVAGERYEVALDIGVSVQAGSAKALKVGERCQVLIRPERVRLDEQGLQVEVLSSTFLGNRYELLVGVAGVEIKVDSDHCPGAGGAFLNLSQAHAWVLQ
jgi:ABC-type Fe3+/spermidine/putrescine transport system ATPase subunit